MCKLSTSNGSGVRQVEGYSKIKQRWSLGGEELFQKFVMI